MDPSSSSSSEPGKLFVGGISSQTEERHLREHFERYGVVREAVVVRDRATGKVRGFAFVEFAEAAAAERVLEEKERTKEKHVICGKEVDVKRAYPRSERNLTHRSSQNGYPNQSPHQYPSPNRRFFNNNNINGGRSDLKIFVGGLPGTITDLDFRSYFEKFGTINDAVVMHDPITQKSRGFGFITFDSPDAVKEVLKNSFHQLNGKRVEVKVAEPKQENNNNHNGNFTSRTFGRRGPAFDGYQGSMYPPYGAGYGLYPGYVAPPLPPFPYVGSGYPAGYGMENYGGVSYGHHYPYLFPNPRGPWYGHSTAGRQSPIPYENGAMYPNYANGGGFGSYAPVASAAYHVEDGLSNRKPVADGAYHVDNGLSNGEPVADGAYHGENGLSDPEAADDGAHHVDNGSSNGEGNLTGPDVQSQVTGGTTTAPTETESDHQ